MKLKLKTLLMMLFSNAMISVMIASLDSVSKEEKVVFIYKCLNDKRMVVNL